MRDRKINKFFTSLSVLLIFVIMPFTGYSAVPKKINYQGYLTDSSGLPIDVAVQMKFCIYNVDTAGTALWCETQSVDVMNGIYNVILGEGTLTEGVPLGDLAFDTQYYVGVTVATNIEMTPRQKLTSVPYAINSEKADYALDADTVDGKHVADLLDKTTYDTNANSKVDSSETADVATDANTVDGYQGADLEESAEIDADIAIHATNASGHHTKTSNFSELSGSATNAQVSDNISINNGRLYAPSGTGNVGIGTTSPSAKLAVNGNIIANAPTSTNHVATKAYVDAAAGGSGCYVSYSGSCLGGFTNKGSTGSWGYCGGYSLGIFRPPGTSCPGGYSTGTSGTAVVCCQ